MNEGSRANTPLTASSRPGGQTSAALKQEAIKYKQAAKTCGRSASKPEIPRRRPTRVGRIMREENFEGMSWTKVLVSGLLNPEHKL